MSDRAAVADQGAPVGRVDAVKPGHKALYDALMLEDMLGLMRIEGKRHGETLAKEFLGGTVPGGWAADLDRLYQLGKMRRTMQAALGAGMPEAQAQRIAKELSTEPGKRVMQAEVDTRRAFLSKAVEDAAREDARQAATATTKTWQTTVTNDFIKANDIVEFNVMAILNSNLLLFKGIVSAGASEMSENDMVRQVWAQEGEIRQDSSEWARAYLLTMFRGLKQADAQWYLSFSRTADGKALNRVLFDGFGRLYGDQSYALGLMTGKAMSGEEL